MAEKYYKIGGTRLTQLADAIRAKTENDYELSPADMVEELNALNIKLQEKTVSVSAGSETDVYPDEGYYGLSQVKVVAGGGGDEGEAGCPVYLNAESAEFGYYGGGEKPTAFTVPEIEGYPYVMYYRSPTGDLGYQWWYLYYSATPFRLGIDPYTGNIAFFVAPNSPVKYYRATNTSTINTSGEPKSTSADAIGWFGAVLDIVNVSDKYPGPKYGTVLWSDPCLSPEREESEEHENGIYLVAESTMDSLAYYIQKVLGKNEPMTPGEMLDGLAGKYGDINGG